MEIKVFCYGQYDIITCEKWPNKFAKRVWFQIPDQQSGQIMQMALVSNGEMEDILPGSMSMGETCSVSYSIESEKLLAQLEECFRPKGEMKIEIPAPRIVSPR